MRAAVVALVGLSAITLPAYAQPLTKAECDEFVMGITELARATAGMLLEVENMNTATLMRGSEKVTVPLRRLDDARKVLISALAEFSLAAKEVGQAFPAEMCPQ